MKIKEYVYMLHWLPISFQVSSEDTHSLLHLYLLISQSLRYYLLCCFTTALFNCTEICKCSLQRRLCLEQTSIIYVTLGNYIKDDHIKHSSKCTTQPTHLYSLNPCEEQHLGFLVFLVYTWTWWAAQGSAKNLGPGLGSNFLQVEALSSSYPPGHL